MVCGEILQLGLSLPELKHRRAASLRVRMAKIAYRAAYCRIGGQVRWCRTFRYLFLRQATRPEPAR
jgi:hypothetical protein